MDLAVMGSSPGLALAGTVRTDLVVVSVDVWLAALVYCFSRYTDDSNELVDRNTHGMKTQHSQILDQLRAAFPRDPIVAAGAFASSGATYLDAVPYAEQLDGKPWDDLDRDYLAVRADALGFLSTRQLAAVLPAYLMLMLERPTSDVPGMLMLILRKPDKQRKGLGRRRFTELVEALTPTQRTAIASALRQFAVEHPEDDSARIPLESFWDCYLPGDE